MLFHMVQKMKALEEKISKLETENEGLRDQSNQIDNLPNENNEKLKRG